MGKKCTRCGAHGFGVFIYSNGLCEACENKREEEEAQKELDELLARNYAACQNRTARAPVLRVYDAFVKKYPEAQINGIGVYRNDENKLSVRLEAGAVYIATYNPLTNSVDVAKKESAQPQSAPAPAKQPPRKSGGGCLTTLVLGVVIFIFFAWLFGGSTSDDNTRSARSQSSSAAQATATPSWDVPVTWARYAAQKCMPDDMTLDTVEISRSGDERYLTVACNMDTMWDSDAYLSAASELICGVIPVIRDKNNYEYVTFIFYGPFIDKLGNETQELAIRAMYSRETVSKINTDYFGRYTSALPDGAIKAADTYMIHPAYRD